MGARLLKVGGVTPFTATDYPGQLAAVVFVQGCPWRCGYCHNPHLQARPPVSALHWPTVLDKLRRRTGLIDGVVFSGGEPTMDPALAGAIADVRALGFKVGLHTACIYPKHLTALLPMLDWVGFDIKAPFDRYERITGVADSGAQARACAEAIIASGVDYECRTTIHPTLLRESEVLELANTLADMGVDNYALQIFRPQGCNDGALNAIATAGYPSGDALAHIAARFGRFTLRRHD
ncbi:anaerobic ribonucleoside-triphosphate reductase activating protein [Janthinobacterium fluminis]|uniref:Anaerobic ribonucleoside-triphosphate reductase activating protein n=1 Tax=Janthinobacterium fluminis TaxID=2987524 RepID=A0ABT5JWD6_9BURK|nr:anaerobic ribonucleoside-triphosphate reductase activating protein [Janthinobacterium fluminis]MDC8757059.1 anaerobic ribonucleoside-triphosphate reductase activating protein [Janthinobacterium fluminis]